MGGLGVSDWDSGEGRNGMSFCSRTLAELPAVSGLGWKLLLEIQKTLRHQNIFVKVHFFWPVESGKWPKMPKNGHFSVHVHFRGARKRRHQKCR